RRLPRPGQRRGGEGQWRSAGRSSTGPNACAGETELVASRPSLPPEPEFGADLEPTHPSEETLRLLALRRSTPVAALGEPGPSAADLDDLLRLAMRVPDHRKLEPWRILVIEGAARGKLGDLFANALKAGDPSASEASLAEACGLPMRAPVIVVVISSPVDD